MGAAEVGTLLHPRHNLSRVTLLQKREQFPHPARNDRSLTRGLGQANATPTDGKQQVAMFRNATAIGFVV
jgi:hypothetical protein